MAEYVRIGADDERNEPPILWPAVASRESYLTLLAAFEAVYPSPLPDETPASPHMASYFRYLGGRLRGAEITDLDANEQHQLLVAQIARVREGLRTDETYHPPNIGHCFARAVCEERAAADLDFLLAGHWPVLWRLAARGHWMPHQRPVRVSGGPAPTLIHESALPPRQTVGGITLSFTPLSGIEFTTAVQFEAPRSFTVMIGSYPELAECRAMVDSWTSMYATRHTSRGMSLGAPRSRRKPRVLATRRPRRASVKLPPGERHTRLRKAEFLLNNAATEAEYVVARREVKALGLDPDAVPHIAPNSR